MTLNTLPNWLTFGRVLAFPAILILASAEQPLGGMIAAWVFVAASLTDILDGYLARRFDQVSDFGRLVDPIADKILVSSGFIMLIHLGRVPAWMVCLILAREFAVSGLRAHAGSLGLVIPARAAGKVKATFQVLAIIFLLNWEKFLFMRCDLLGVWFLWIAFATTLWSGFEYFRDYFRALGKGKSQDPLAPRG